MGKEKNEGAIEKSIAILEQEKTAKIKRLEFIEGSLQNLQKEKDDINEEITRINQALNLINPLKKLQNDTVQPEFDSAILSASIEELGFPKRFENCMKNSNIQTVEQLINMTPKKLLKVKNFGKVTLNEVIKVLTTKGLCLKE